MDFRVPADHPSLPGHFPGRPVVPGVVLLDRVLEAIEAEGAPVGALRLPQAKFLRPLLPEETARIELQTQERRWRFRIFRGDELIASGEVAAE
ncbi:beta-hydroxyacyl-ACP dehydratase [Luteimonas gilva]|uniref:Beta-hydroxyacyl-ACP dehydratase n=1 Tax=Luteimonas gilva TaxID=2572684 RepID=A0A4V6XUS4_9GAMM|nr:beta-hydroxyacyl-ACP dehydratase [Luteimonas gilva]TKR30363.1 beta-hydroxyacyl-ACP dehydratase [Luteimonas gilva]